MAFGSDYHVPKRQCSRDSLVVVPAGGRMGDEAQRLRVTERRRMPRDCSPTVAAILKRKQFLGLQQLIR